MQILFGILMLVVYFGATIYLFVRIRQALPAISLVRIVYTVAFVFTAFSLFAYMFCRNILPSGLLTFMYLVGSTWLIALIYLTVFFLFTDLILFANKKILFIPENFSPRILRQIQVVAGFVILAIVLISGYCKFNNPVVVGKNIVINKKLLINNNNKSSLKILLISDLHLGHGIGKARLSRYVEMLNAQNADIVLIAGDLIDTSPQPLFEQRMFEEINRINAPQGIFMCMGNHEYISGVAQSLDFIKKTKITPLLDSVITIGNVSIIGRKDLSAHNRLELSELTGNIPADNIKILLDHQPYNLLETQQNNIDLQISGHTHNGQFFPINLIVKKLFELGYGYAQKGNTHYIVSSGLGLWGPPYRIGTQSELWVATLTFNQ
ncbi:MAG: metallophosphoesterase [Prevotellaceae bacterium]|nr:metallophosphoesterase [Prevotellaceae bacterium]